MDMYSNICLFAMLFGAYFLFLIVVKIVGGEWLDFEEDLVLLPQA